ncbi:hypothetical protein [Stenotrophomonas indicatrix]|uniref:hypothetical protein n=1 Tax=Stenotrophomonas indicatrix TaxID=2045451 RepID=UPI002FD882A9
MSLQECERLYFFMLEGHALIGWTRNRRPGAHVVAWTAACETKILPRPTAAADVTGLIAEVVSLHSARSGS